MARSHRAAMSRLYDVAVSQQGYFTAKQAKQCGFADSAQHYHVQVGNWRREHRGIYQLARFPQGDQAHLVLWSLWSRNREEKPEGAYSHQTALVIHDLSDLMPARLHMTVLRAFRRSSEIPAILALHYADLPEADVEAREGFRVTRPLRTILDLIHDGEVPRDVVIRATRQALARGMITRAQLARVPLNSKERRWLQETHRERA